MTYKLFYKLFVCTMEISPQKAVIPLAEYLSDHNIQISEIRLNPELNQGKIIFADDFPNLNELVYEYEQLQPVCNN